MKITYQIEFFNEWHCGSGLAAGADVDALVIKDKDNLPFVPGKTIKGLVREAMENLISLAGDNEKEQLFFDTFGYFDTKTEMVKGTAFFANAELSDSEKQAIKSGELAEYLYRNIASTAIDDEGIAQKGSLRKIEVAVPCKLNGTILGVPDELAALVCDALKFIKRLGQNRNRGLGRCSFTVLKKEEEK